MSSGQKKESRVVLDTSILVSAAISDGKPAQLLERCEDGIIEVVVTPAILAETDDVLRRDRLPFENRHVDNYIGKLLSEAQIIVPQVDIVAVEDDPDDNIVLEAAVTAGADAIISGDSHLLDLEAYQGIPILTANTYLTKSSE